MIDDPDKKTTSRFSLSAGSNKRLFVFWLPLLGMAIVFWFFFSGSREKKVEAREVKQTEQGWILETVIRDGVQMAALEAKAADPLSSQRTVKVKPELTEKGHAPSYAVSIKLGPEGKSIETHLVPKDTVWSVETYADVFAQILKAFQITPPSSSPGPFENSLLPLSSPTSSALQTENHRVSQLLSENPLSAEAHEQAALICAVLGFREQGWKWWDPRQASNRTIAHLAMAKALNPGEFSDSGKIADLILGLLMDRKTDCAAKIAELELRSEKEPVLKPWVRTAKIRNARDWRILENVSDPTLLELLEEFRTKAENVNTQAAVDAMGERDIDTLVDWGRIVQQFSMSVQLGHRFDRPSLEKEIKDAAGTYGEDRVKSVDDLIHLMNSEPGGAVQKNGEKAFKFQVLDDGIWGQFFQRHLFYAMGHTEFFLRNHWGVKEYAEEFDQKTRAQFKTLSLFPLYEAWMIQKGESLAPSERQALARLLLEHPEQVRDSLWWRTMDPVHLSAADGYDGPSAKEWFNPIVPSGTAFAVMNRLYFLAKNRLGDAELYKPYLEVAPTRLDLKWAYVKAKYGENPSPDILKQEFGEALDFNFDLMEKMVETMKNDAIAYPAGLLKIAAFDSEKFYDLGQYYEAQGEKEKAADAYQHYFDQAEDRVGVANRMDWLVQYYEAAGKTTEATKIAEAGAEVYSFTGLETMAKLMESRDKLFIAESYFSKISERYQSDGPLLGFYERQMVNHPEYREKLDGLQKDLFPEGMQKVVVADFKGEPSQGVRVDQTSPETKKAGLSEGALIVAINGVKVVTFNQYSMIRSADPSPVMRLIVYQNGIYQELEASPPGKRFDVDMSTFPNK